MKQAAWIEIHQQSDVLRVNVQETVTLADATERTLSGVDKTIALATLPDALAAQLRDALTAVTAWLNTPALPLDANKAIASLSATLGQSVVLASSTVKLA